MPIWSGSDTTALERVKTAHTAETGRPPTVTADAPATWALLGEHVDHAGGVVLMALSSQRTAVAVSFRDDDTIRVLRRYRSGAGEPLSETDQITLTRVAERAAAQQPSVDDRGRPVDPPTPDGGLAARLGGILWTMIHRQLLSRDTPGVDITVVSDIPDRAGLGALSAADAAFALALHHSTGDTDDVPARARLAEVCTQAAVMFSRYPALRSRHTTALRGATGTVSAIDYSDGSVTQVPHLVTPEVRAAAVFAPATGKSPSQNDEIRTRQRFVDQAERTFGVDSLRLLPDAPERVAEWLEAVHAVHGPDGVPELDQARSWLDFYTAETGRAQQLASMLRSRRHGDTWQVIDSSQAALTHGYGLAGADAALAKLCVSRGALSARSAAAGISAAVIVVVPADKEHNFVSDLSADGLIVVPLEDGEPASVGR